MTRHPPPGTTTVSAGELNRRTAQLLDRVHAGEQVAITRHGMTVALLSPAVEHQLAGLVAAGLLIPAERGAFFATEPHRQ